MASDSGDIEGVKGVKVSLRGQPSFKKNKELSEHLNKLRQEYGDEIFQLAASSNGLHPHSSSYAGQDLFPVRLTKVDPYDNVAQLKKDAPTELGEKVLTTDDLEWMKRKQEQMAGADFKTFVASMYDARDPSQAALLDKIYPELNNERESIIDQRAELEKRIAKIRLRGPQGPDDLKLLWALGSGAIEPPKGSLWDPASWFVGGDSTDVRFARGLFNPNKYYFSSRNAASLPFDKLHSVLGTVPARSLAQGTTATISKGTVGTNPSNPIKLLQPWMGFL